MNNFGFNVLVGLNKLGKHVYGGTADRGKVAKRRAKNKLARKQRQVNRNRDVNAR